MFLNTVMCLDVLHLLPHAAHLHALVRSAGSRGAAVYEELVEVGGVALCIELMVSDGERCTDRTTADDVNGGDEIADCSSSSSPLPKTMPVIITHIPLQIAPKSYDYTKKLETSTVVVSHHALLRAGYTFNILRGYRIQHIRYNYEKGMYVAGGGGGNSPPPLGTTSVGQADRYTETFPLISTDTMTITGCDHVVAIQNAFLSDIYIHSINLSPLRNVTTIGDSFLRNCRTLRNVDLTPLRSVVRIGNHFMRSCWEISKVDMTLMKNLTSVGYYCLAECRELSVVEMGELGRIDEMGVVGTLIEYIGDEFLFRCRSLTSITLPTLPHHHQQSVRIQDRFLCGCKGLMHVDLQPLANTTTLGDYFMGGCTSLRAIDLTPLRSVQCVGRGFLGGCVSLTEINLSSFGKVRFIGRSFLGGCEGLVQLDLTPLSEVHSIFEGFLSQCSGLKNIDVSKLQNVVNVEQTNFLELCAGLSDKGSSSCSVDVDDLREGTLKVAYKRWASTVVA